MHLTVRRPQLALVAGAAALTLVAAGCGGNDNSKSAKSTSSTPATTSTPSSTAGRALTLSADPNGALKFNKASLTAKAGKVSIAMMNPASSGLQHGIAVEGNGVDKDGPAVAAGKTSKLAVTLKPGKYEFYCPVDGHKAAGMKGTLIVK